MVVLLYADLVWQLDDSDFNSDSTQLFTHPSSSCQPPTHSCSFFNLQSTFTIIFTISSAGRFSQGHRVLTKVLRSVHPEASSMNASLSHHFIPHTASTSKLCSLHKPDDKDMGASLRFWLVKHNRNSNFFSLGTGVGLIDCLLLCKKNNFHHDITY